MQSPLPPAWVDRLFGRLALRYGSAWLRMWEGLDMQAVRADWADVLAGLHDRPDALRYGCDNLPPEKPPTSTQFRAICNRAPEYVAPALPAPPVSPQDAARLRDLLAPTGGPIDTRAWAHRLKARHEDGERLTAAQVDMYRSALRQPTAPSAWIDE